MVTLMGFPVTFAYFLLTIKPTYENKNTNEIVISIKPIAT